MNKAKKNIVVVGFDKNEKKSLSLPLIENNTTHYINSIKEARNYQGYLLLIDNKDNKSIIELDKKFRKIFNKYERLWLYNESYNNFLDKEKWSRIEKIGREIFEDYSYSFGEDWEDYKKKQEYKIINKRSNESKSKKLDILYHYLKDYKSIKTTKISHDLNIKERTIQRYMMDINNVYRNIGYDYSKNEWYIIW